MLLLGRRGGLKKGPRWCVVSIKMSRKAEKKAEEKRREVRGASEQEQTVENRPHVDPEIPARKNSERSSSSVFHEGSGNSFSRAARCPPPPKAVMKMCWPGRKSSALVVVVLNCPTIVLLRGVSLRRLTTSSPTSTLHNHLPGAGSCCPFPELGEVLRMGVLPLSQLFRPAKETPCLKCLRLYPQGSAPCGDSMSKNWNAKMIRRWHDSAEKQEQRNTDEILLTSSA